MVLKEVPEALIETLGTACLFNDARARVNSMCFDKAGEMLLTASDDDQVNLYSLSPSADSEMPSLKKTFFFRACGIQRVRFAHHQQCLLGASKLADGSIYYQSMYDNKFLCIYKGHTDRISSLELSPCDDNFITGSLDRSLRIWDLRSPSCVATVTTPSAPKLAYDPTGLIFACATSKNIVKLFDARSLEQPFASFKVIGPNGDLENLQWSNVQFSPDGNRLLLCSRQNFSVILDSFAGEKKCEFTSYDNKMQTLIEGSLTADGKWFCIGSESGKVYIYPTTDGDVSPEKSGKFAELIPTEEYKVLDFGDNTPVGSLIWNPCKVMMATSCGPTVALWIPEDGASLIE
jgi:COMPASS component SWD2